MADLGGAFDVALREARAAHVRGAVAEAVERYDALLRSAPQHVELLHLRGVAALQLGAVAEGVAYIERALALKPDYAEARSNLGNGFRALQRPQDAVAAYDAALMLKPGLVEALTNRGEVVLSLGRAGEALANFDAALEGKAEHLPALLGKASALLALRHPEEALSHVEQVLALRPNSAPALVLQGRSLMLTRSWTRALAAFDAAIAVDPASLDGRLYCAMTLMELERSADAKAKLQELLASAPDFAIARLCSANLALNEGRLREAVVDFEQLLGSGVELDYVRGHRLHTKMRLSDWSDIDAASADIDARLRAGEKSSHPMVMLAVRDDPALHRRCAEIFAPKITATPLNSTSGRDKIRVAYVSSDFHDHPVSHLVAGLIESHDRERFEVMAISLGVRRDHWTHRIASATAFIDGSAMSDAALVRLVRRGGADVAVDLNGYTENARPQLFAARLAPVQMSYLGYLGTTGAKFIDYLIADNVLAPPELRDAYSEKIACLPAYQWNGDAALAPGVAGVRADHGLPNDGFVFCSFNNNYKITPELFAAWMEILRRTPGSVLWLYAANAEACANLSREAQLRGVDAARLVFAKKAPVAEHLSRQALADLMLDTFPYTGGATGGNALRAGLPVLTLQGRSFASRMGASLLANVDLDSLITRSVDEYVARATELASTPTTLVALRAKLESKPPPPPDHFVLALEDIYRRAVLRQRAGLAPEHLEIVGDA